MLLKGMILFGQVRRGGDVFGIASWGMYVCMYCYGSVYVRVCCVHVCVYVLAMLVKGCQFLLEDAEQAMCNSVLYVCACRFMYVCMNVCMCIYGLAGLPVFDEGRRAGDVVPL